MLTQANIDALNAILQAVKDQKSDKEIATAIGMKSSASSSNFLSVLRRIGVQVPDRERGGVANMKRELEELRRFKAGVEASQRATTLLRPNGVTGRLDSVM